MQTPTPTAAAGQPATLLPGEDFEGPERTFTLALGQTAVIAASGEDGTVIARSEHVNSEPQYLLRYCAADGRATETWWGQSALEPVTLSAFGVDVQQASTESAAEYAIRRRSEYITPDPEPTGRLDIPRIGHPWHGQGGLYAGIARCIEGGPDYHLILGQVEPVAYQTWDQAVSWAAQLVAGNQTDWALPTRAEHLLLAANAAEAFSTHWYWGREQFMQTDAWVLHLSSGKQMPFQKSGLALARAVRRLPVASVNHN